VPFRPRYLRQRRGVRVSGQRQLDGGLPDVGVVEPPGRHHELDGLRQVGQLLLGVHRAVGPHAVVWVAADEAQISAARLAVLELHCRETGRGERN